MSRSEEEDEEEKLADGVKVPDALPVEKEWARTSKSVMYSPFPHC